MTILRFLYFCVLFATCAIHLSTQQYIFLFPSILMSWLYAWVTIVAGCTKVCITPSNTIALAAVASVAYIVLHFLGTWTKIEDSQNGNWHIRMLTVSSFISQKILQYFFNFLFILSKSIVKTDKSPCIFVASSQFYRAINFLWRWFFEESFWKFRTFGFWRWQAPCVRPCVCMYLLRVSVGRLLRSHCHTECKW